MGALTRTAMGVTEGIAVPWDDPGFWTGAGAAGLTGAVGLILRKLAGKESLEDRLQRWQIETVQQVRSENASVRAENATLRTEVSRLRTASERLYIVESCLRIVVVKLQSIAADSPELQQVGALLSRVILVDEDTPDVMRDLLSQIDRIDGRKGRGRRGK